MRITNGAVADSLRQLWSLLDKQLRADPDYAKLPLLAGRKV